MLDCYACCGNSNPRNLRLKCEPAAKALMAMMRLVGKALALEAGRNLWMQKLKWLKETTLA